MGTNYYLKKTCTCCSHEKEEHLGKSSGGWRFLFQGTEGITSYNEWRTNLQTKMEDGYKLCNEYGDEVTTLELIDLVRRKQTTRQAPTHFGYHVDPRGFEFVMEDFS